MRKVNSVVFRLESPTVVVDEDIFVQIARFIPTVALGYRLWLSINATAKGEVMQAWVHSSPGGLEEIDESEPVDPRSAVRILKEIAGFQTERLRHLSVAATDELLPSAKPAAAQAEAGSSSESVPQRSSPKPNQRVHDQHLLSALEDFITGDAFTLSVREFAAEHAHKFKPLTLDDEHQ